MATKKTPQPRVNRSKYNFNKLAVGDTITIKPIDLHSMKVAFNFFNKTHGKKVEISTEEISDSEIKVTRIK